MQVESREERDSKSQKEGEEEGDPMDRNEFIPNEEWIRQTMIMQDQIFREQNRELHRLIDLQKKIGPEIQKEIEQKRSLDRQTTTTSPAIIENIIDQPLQALPNPGIDPTPSNIDLERPAKGDTSADASHRKKIDEGCSLRKHDVEPNLSIGGEMSKTEPVYSQSAEVQRRARNRELQAEKRTKKRGIHRKEEGGRMDNERIQYVESTRKAVMRKVDSLMRQVGEDFLQTATLLTTNINPSYCLPPAFPNPGSDPSLSNFDLGMPVHGDFSTDTSHTMKLDDGCSEEEPETELTLCTGGEMSKGKWKIEELDTELTLSIGGEWNRSKPKVMVEKKFASFLSMESNQSSAAPDKSGSKKASEPER